MNTHKIFSFGIITLLFFALISSPLLAQDQNCDFELNKRTKLQYQKALNYLEQGHIQQTRSMLNELTQNYPLFAKGFLSSGVLCLQDYYSDISKAESYFYKALEICADSTHIANFYLGKIYFGKRQFTKAQIKFKNFLAKPEYCSSTKLSEAKNYLEYATASAELMANPVPFKPVKVSGISSSSDEYLPIISPDNEFALYTRRTERVVDRGFGAEYKQIETFSYSLRQADGTFDRGFPMPYPFNQSPNEGAPTLTIDNNDLYYTFCVFDPKTKYLNCDLLHSHFNGKFWTEPKSLGSNINSPNTWESQPSVNADGNVIYFASNREGGIGGYDIYKTIKQSDGTWSDPINLGPEINSIGHEKSPYIHSDSQTLYFSSDGIPGLGGFDIFYARMDSSMTFGEPSNIGYPINSFEDDLGFFASTDGNYGYYASNRFDENHSWNLYHFPLYEKAKPQKVLFVKGEVKNEGTNELVRAKVEIRNLNNRTIKEIPVDSVTGKYVAVLLFRDDQLLTVKKEGFVYESKYIASSDTVFSKPSIIDLHLKPIEVGQSYKINDIYFATNLAELTLNSLKVIQEFFDFLKSNQNLRIEIQGHTDNIGSIADNQNLSERRAKAVFDYLIHLGIKPDRLTYTGYGESNPVENNDSKFGRSQNRRTVFVIIEK